MLKCCSPITCSSRYRHITVTAFSATAMATLNALICPSLEYAVQTPAVPVSEGALKSSNACPGRYVIGE